MNKPNPNKALVIPMGRKTRRTNKPKPQPKSAWTPVTTTNVRFDAWGLAMQALRENGKL